MKMKILAVLIACSMMLLVGAAMAKRGGNGGRGDGPVIYVNGQGLYYDSIVTADPLPYNEHNAHTFQKLMDVNGDDAGGLQCEYGPGDSEYKGGRWWLDLNGNDEMDPVGIDHYFNCPLLGPGREMP